MPAGRAKRRPTLFKPWSLLLGFRSVGKAPGNAWIRPPAPPGSCEEFGVVGLQGDGSPGLWGFPALHAGHLAGVGRREQDPPGCVFYT